jgi:GR25 family glycosyltransferase involved in LPS biosynthesis
MHFSTFLSTAAFSQVALAGYVLQDDYMQGFYEQFDFFNAADPTNGMYLCPSPLWPIVNRI